MEELRENSSNEIEYVLKSPVTQNEIRSVQNVILNTINNAWNVFDSQGESMLQRYLLEKGEKAHNRNDNISTDANKETAIEKVEDKDNAKINGDARRYQIELLEQAKLKNTIITLGTGKGKTLIAILLIRHFSFEFDEKNKQTWFLVPSVALALQQANTIRSNLPFKVAIACHTAVGSEKARTQLAAAQIVVATHGSAIELLRHYSDLFSLNRVNLLVFDECHYASKNHNYATLMRNFYHTLPPDGDNRPKVLGLTASPIINVKKGKTDPHQLEQMLRDLEATLHARIISLSSIGLTTYDSGIISNSVEEHVVYYYNQPQNIPFASANALRIHPMRKKELHQLSYLYTEYGAHLTGLYINSLINEVSRNKFEKETQLQFDEFLENLRNFKQECLSQFTEENQQDGRSCKLLALEDTIHKLFTTTKTNQNVDSCTKLDGIVGIVFVDRRISALALQNYLNHLYSNTTNKNDKDGIYRIRADSLTRKNTDVFKYLHSSHHVSKQKQEQAYKQWLHVMKNTKKVLDKLRRREINILISTSVVEEGVDVDACSFVIVLDGIKTTKSYIQMKGRARSLNAKFFVFQEKNVQNDGPTNATSVTLAEAIQTENIIASYIGSRKNDYILSPDSSTKRRKTFLHTSQDEITAINQGEYRALHGMVDLSSAKSLVNRYASSIPMDITSRSSRDALLPYLPVYEKYRLILPSHLPDNVRCVSLSSEHITTSKKKNESKLALMACVRLHKLKILNNRLLPLKRDDILKHLFSTILTPIPQITPELNSPITIQSHSSQKILMYTYPVRQIGSMFQKNQLSLKGQDRTLCILTPEPLKSIPDFNFNHSELGPVQCITGSGTEVILLLDQLNLCAQYFVVLMNARWRRRTGRTQFRYSEKARPGIIPYYFVASLTGNGELDWDHMKCIVKEYKRSEDDRKKAAQEWSCKNEKTPRLWAPLYDPNVTYISFNQSQQTCASPFPEPDIDTYQDYFLKKRSFKVSKDCILFYVQRTWTLPQTLTETISESAKAKVEKSSTSDGKYCVGLNSVLLPIEACVEAPLADARLYLDCILLPQILYQLERQLTIQMLLTHVAKHFPTLSKYLEKIPNEDIMTALTAKSCALNFSYDRLEYLGDAVLKLIHTDALINSNNENLKQWISCMHEGDLTALRTGFGCNDRLKEAAENNGISPFILAKPLGRGIWTPVGLESVYNHPEEGLLVDNTENCDENQNIVSTKVQADVIEAILGLVYIFYGYKESTDVAEEIGVSLPQKIDSHASYKSNASLSKDKTTFVKKFLAKETFCNMSLFQEAFTHPSFIHSNVPSYQRLEWIGDAVLCLCAREWVYKSYPMLQVKHLLLIETVLVCNETLAFLGCSNGVHKHIEHCDSTMPSRLESYELSMEDMVHKGIWSADAPKVVADVVEALLGAAHVDKDFSHGQNSAQFVISPITLAISRSLESNSVGLCEAKAFDMMHPKQKMTEMCEVFKVKTWKEDSKIPLSCPLWDGSSWISHHRPGEGVIAQVTWFGISVIAVKETSSLTVAKFNACTLISAILEQHPEVKTKLTLMSRSMGSKFERSIQSTKAAHGTSRMNNVE